MKQLAFMIGFTALGTLGVIIQPFYGVFVYYLFAVLRPQFIWQWSLPEGISWSLYVAIATIGAAVLGLVGLLPVESGDASDETRHGRPTLAHVCFALFACWVCVTYFTAQNTNAAYKWFMDYLKIFVMYFVAAYLVRRVGQVWALYLMVGLTMGYISYEVNFLYFVNGYLGIQRNGYGGLDNNGAGLMLAMGVPICWFAFEALGRWWRWLFLGLIPVIIHATLMTYSRGAMLSIIVTVPLVVLRSRMRARLLGGLALSVVLVLPLLAGKEIRERFFSIQQQEIDASANSRRDSWLAAYRIAMDYPVFGVGIRNSNLFSHRYGADSEGRTIHSQYLGIMADNGFIGLGLYLLVLGSSWMTLRRTRQRILGREDQESVRVRALSNGLESAMFLFCFGALFLAVEVFELPYLLLVMVATLPAVNFASDNSAAIPQELQVRQPCPVYAGEPECPGTGPPVFVNPVS